MAQLACPGSPGTEAASATWYAVPHEEQTTSLIFMRGMIHGRALRAHLIYRRAGLRARPVQIFLR